MKNIFTLGTITVSTMLSNGIASAAAPYSLRTTLKDSMAAAEGSAFNLQEVNVGAYFDFLTWLRPGISIAVEHSESKTNLFDNYNGIGLNADFLIETPDVGNFSPFFLIRLPVFHRFQAGGKITRHITNGTDRSDGSIEFPSSQGTISTSSPREERIGYELKGQALGVGLDVGSGFQITNDLSIIAAVGYSWRNLVINEAKGSNYSMIGNAEYAYDQRHGLEAKGKTIGEGYDVKAERKSRFLGAASLSIGLNFKI